MRNVKGELIPNGGNKAYLKEQSTTLAQYGDNTLAGRIDLIPESPYTGYLASLSSGSR